MLKCLLILRGVYVRGAGMQKRMWKQKEHARWHALLLFAVCLILTGKLTFVISYACRFSLALINYRFTDWC